MVSQKNCDTFKYWTSYIFGSGGERVMFVFLQQVSSNICNVGNCYLLLLQYHAMFLTRVKNKKCSVFALPYVTDMKSLRTFSLLKKRL